MGPKNAKLLLVDDEPLQLKVLKTMVDTLPYSLEVVSCATGQEAIDYLEDHANRPLPDIIITDYMMPDIDGLELLAYVREHNQFKSVSVLMVSALDQPDIQEKALQLGVDDFLRRPLNRYELQARCNSFIHFSHHVKGTLEHAVFFEQRFTLGNSQYDIQQNEALEAFIKFSSQISHYPTGYPQVLEDITLLITRKLGLSELLCKQTCKAVQLHGLGFNLQKHAGKKKETAYEAGYSLLHTFSFPVLQLAAEICRSQDEWFDGTGRPDKLAGIDIPLSARIATIVIHIASRAVSNSSSVKQQSLAEELGQLSGNQLDPELVQIIQENFSSISTIIQPELEN